jgi:hypothetical protein
VIVVLGVAMAAAALIGIAHAESDSVQTFSDHCVLCLATTEEVMEPMVHVANPRVAFGDDESLRGVGMRGRVYQLSAGNDSESTASLGFNQTTSAGMSDIQLRDVPPTIVVTTGASDFDSLLAQASHLPHALAELQTKAVRAANVRIHGPQPAAAADHTRGFGSWTASTMASPAGSPNKGASRALGELPPVPDHPDYPEYPMFASVNDASANHGAPALQGTADGQTSAATADDEDSEHLVQTVSDLGYAPWSRSAPHITPPHGPASPPANNSGPVPEIQVGSPMPGQPLLPGQVDPLGDAAGPSAAADSADNVSKSYLSAFVAWNDGNDGGQSHSTSRTTSRAVSRRSSHMSEDSTASSTQRRVSRLSDALKAAQSFRSSSRRASAAPAGFMQDSPNGPGASLGPIASESEIASASSPCNVSPLADQADRSHSGPYALSGNDLDEAGRSLLERLHDVVTFDLKQRHGATLHCGIPQLFEAEPFAASTEPQSFSAARKSPKGQLLRHALRRQLSENEIAARRHVSQLFLAAVLHIVHMYDGQVAKLTATSVTATWNAMTPFPFFEARAAKCAQHIAQTLEQLMLDLREGVDLLDASQSPQSSPGHGGTRGWQADLASPGSVPVGDRKRVGDKFSDHWAVGVASGPLLVGYSGTEQQCAPSLIGPSLTFAQQLVALGVQTGAHVVIEESCLQGAAQHGLVYPCDVILARVGPRIVFELSFATALRGDALQRLRDSVRRLTAGATQIASCNYKAAQEPLAEAVRMLQQSSRGAATRAVLRHCKRLAAIAKEFDAAFALHEKQVDSDDGDASKVAFVHYARKMPGWFLFEHRAVRFVNELLNAGMDLHGELPRVSGNTPPATETSWASTPQSGILLAAGKTPGTTAMSPSADAITRQLRGYMQRGTKPGGSSKEITIEPAMVTEGSDSDEPMAREDTFMTHEEMRSRRSRSRSVGSQLSAVSAESYDDTECSFTPRGESGVTEYKDDHGRRWRRSQRRLGAGTFGEVFLGLRGNGELVAIKCIPLPPVDGSPESPHVNYEGRLESFASEIRALTTVRHVNVVSYLSSFIDGEDAVVVMEYVPGGSLTQLVQRFGPPPMAAIRGYLNGVLSGLMALHRRGIVHCDLSTSNVLVGGDGAVKLTDFGCSVSIGSITHSVSGTPAFMAPEACNGSPGKASDIWSFGVVALFLLTGRLPYEAAVVEVPAELVRKVGLLASDSGAEDAAKLTIPVCRDAMSALSRERPESVALASPVFGTEAVTVLEFAESDQVLAGPLSTPPGAEVPLEALLAASLAESCLVVDAAKRPTAEQLLRHGFFFQT